MQNVCKRRSQTSDLHHRPIICTNQDPRPVEVSRQEGQQLHEEEDQQLKKRELTRYVFNASGPNRENKFRRLLPSRSAIEHRQACRTPAERDLINV